MQGEQAMGLELEAEYKIDISKMNVKRTKKHAEGIGSGASSTVHSGSYRGKKIAVKIYKKGVSKDANGGINLWAQQMFNREVTVLSKLCHEHIVKFVGADINGMAIAEEYIDGENLFEYFTTVRKSAPDIGLALKWAIQISKALEYLHSENILHRDLKPGNIMLTENRSVIKLIDFGLSRIEEAQMTPNMGTKPFIAPEVLQESGDDGLISYDKKVDVYSFSMVLWELLTHKKPRDCPEGKRPNDKHGWGNVPNDLISLIKQCWNDDPLARPHFSEISKRLQESLDSHVQLQGVSSKDSDDQQAGIMSTGE